MMHGNYGNSFAQWEPDRTKYDFIGVDGYNRDASVTFSSLFTPAKKAAINRGKQLFIEETGCAENPGSSTYKENWFIAAKNTCLSWGTTLYGVNYSDVLAEADFRIDTSQLAVSGY